MNVSIQDPQQPAQACVIWMHGLGADGSNMMGAANQLPMSLPVRHVFIDAPVRPVTLNNHMPMRAWYDIIGAKLTDREDREGLVRSESMIGQVIERQMEEGFNPGQIFLAGFSQGGAMALFTGLRYPSRLGGIVSLSGYLPLPSECESIANTAVPVFVAAGRFDQIVMPAWTRQSYDWLLSRGFQHVSWHEYPMEHNICIEEIRDLAHWLTLRISSNGVK